MARKNGRVSMMKKMAAAIVAAVLIYQLLRRIGYDVITGKTNSVTDKIANMFLPNTTAGRIYEAALQRLKTKFSETQAVVLAMLMVQQSKYETANYTSNVLRNNQNAFGYKYFKGSKYQKGAGTLSPELNSYARYADVADSAREVADWIGRRKVDFQGVRDGNESDYAAALKKSDYYGQAASAYASGLQVYELA